MFNLNQNQMLAIASGVCSFLAGSTAQLTNLFGQAGASYAVSAITLTGGIVSVILAVTSGQSSIVKQVAAMPGVEKITVNAQANQTLAAIAVDPASGKVAPSNGSATQLAAIAKSQS